MLNNVLWQGKLFCYAAVVVCMFLASGCAVRPVADVSITLSQGGTLADIRLILQHGDWLVTRGVHGSDNFVSTVTNAPLSHAAIYDAEFGQVIEAEAIGVHATPLADFIAKSQRLMVIRPMWASEQNSAQAVELARGWVGKDYNLTGLVGLNVPDSYYCTQLLIAAYKPAMTQKPENPIPQVIQPKQMFHWGRILYDSGP